MNEESEGRVCYEAFMRACSELPPYPHTERAIVDPAEWAHAWRAAWDALDADTQQAWEAAATAALATERVTGGETMAAFLRSLGADSEPPLTEEARRVWRAAADGVREWRRNRP